MLLGACGDEDGNPVLNIGGGDAAAEVGDRKISTDEVQRAVERGLEGEGVKVEADALGQQLLTTKIRLALMREEAERQGYTLPAERVAKSRSDLETQLKQAGGVDKAAAAEGMGAAELAEFIEATTYQEELSAKLGMEPPITDAAVKEAYDANKAELETVEASHILVKDKALADKLVSDLKGGADFAALAKEHSTDKGSGANGGALGPTPRGRFVAEFEKTVWSAPVGEVTEPVKTEFGYHIIKVTKRPSEAELKEVVRTRLATQAGRMKLLERVRKGIKVTVNPRYGRWDAEKLQVVPAAADPDDPSTPAPSGPPQSGSPAPGAPEPGAPQPGEPEPGAPEPSPSTQ
jgi:foldase protein PrsA